VHRVDSLSGTIIVLSVEAACSSFNEVTFYAKVRNGEWKSTGTDDTRPYRCSTTSARSLAESR
jgi:hypothetical protein